MARMSKTIVRMVPNNIKGRLGTCTVERITSCQFQSKYFLSGHTSKNVWTMLASFKRPV